MKLLGKRYEIETSIVSRYRRCDVRRSRCCRRYRRFERVKNVVVGCRRHRQQHRHPRRRAELGHVHRFRISDRGSHCSIPDPGFLIHILSSLILKLSFFKYTFTTRCW